MRIKMSVNAKKNRKAVIKQAKGYWGRRSTQYRVANEAVMKSLNYAFIGRKLKKRNFRALWISRINAACRINGTTYNKFMNGLKNAKIELNRKVLADLAVNDEKAFAELVKKAVKATK